MREYSIHTVSFSGPFGRINLEVDGGLGFGKGAWRQKPPFNSNIAAAGNWTCIQGNYQHPHYYFYDSDGFFAKPILTMENCYFSPGMKGKGIGNIGSQKSCDVVWSFESSQKVQEWTIADLAEKIVDSTWRITGSCGISYGVGEGVTVEGNTGRIFLKGDSEPAGTQHELVYSTAGLGIGISDMPVVISGSTESMPSGGIGKIFSRRNRMSLMDFEGICGIAEVNGAVGMTKMQTMGNTGAGVYLVMFGNGTLSGLASWGLMWGTSVAVAANPKSSIGNIGGAMTLGTCKVMR